MLGEYEVQAIFPATDKHKDKYATKKFMMYEESA